jgi:DNA repair protein RecO (recombination protein O)
MRTYKDTVVVIKSLNYSETDKILTVFGERTGKFSMLAKGIRKITSKNRGNMQTLSMSKISFYKGQGMPLLLESEGEQFVDFGTEDMKNLERVLIPLNKLLAEEEVNRKIFKALKKIITDGLHIENVNKFRTLFLNEEGLLADTGQCSICSKTEQLDYINLKTFALVCENCYSKREIKPSDVLRLDKKVYADRKFTSALDSYIRNILANL